MVISGRLVHSHVARKYLSPKSMSCTSHLPLTTHSAVINVFIFILVPGDPEFVVLSSAQEDKSYTKSCGHAGPVNLQNADLYLPLIKL